MILFVTKAKNLSSIKTPNGAYGLRFFCVDISMDNETIAIIIIFGTPLALMLAGSIWWAWKDKDNLD